MLFILDDDHKEVEVELDSISTWGAWCENIDNRRIGYTQFTSNGIDVQYSTVCLGIKSFCQGGYETAFIINGDFLELVRHNSYSAAVDYHNKVVAANIEYISVHYSRYKREINKYTRMKKQICCVVRNNLFFYNTSI